MDKEQTPQRTPPPQDDGTVTIPARAFRCVTRVGFINEFWDVLASWSTTREATQYEVFDYLNDEYKNIFGEYRFNTYDAFRRYRDRLYRKKQDGKP